VTDLGKRGELRRAVVVRTTRNRPATDCGVAGDAAIPRLRRELVAPCTTTVRGLPTEVVLEPGDDPIGKRSAVNLDSVESV
jgi:mRNA interferase MazF